MHMKTMVYTSFCLLFLSIGSLLAQSTLQIKDQDGNDVSGQVFMAHEVDANGIHNALFEVKNNASASKSVGMRRYEMQAVSGTKNYFCWSICYLPKLAGVKPVWEDPNPVNIDANSSVNILHAYHDPQGINGLATYRYVVFDTSNPSDSAYVDVHFDVNTSVSDAISKKLEVSLYPNPAQDKIYVSFNSPQTVLAASLSIRNFLGETVKTVNLKEQGAKEMVSVANLPSGVYFYQVSVNGVAQEAKRLVIK